jgi:hypothetical protein
VEVVVVVAVVVVEVVVVVGILLQNEPERAPVCAGLASRLECVRLSVKSSGLVLVIKFFFASYLSCPFGTSDNRSSSAIIIFEAWGA